MKKILIIIAVVLLLVSVTLAVSAAANQETPNTNEDNKTKGWAYYEVVSSSGGNVVLKFVSTRSIESCFEYRTNGDVTQIISENGSNNYNPAITDGLYPYVCVNNSTETITLSGIEYVEIRNVFGAESDERFDWTTFGVNQPSNDKDQCKKGGWTGLYGSNGNPFKNQGQCIKFVNTGK